MMHRTSRRLVLRRAVTPVETLVILLVTVLCISLLAVTLLRRTELGRQARCAANLKAIETAMYVYADQNHDDWPVAGHAEATQDRVAAVEYVRAIGSYRGRADDARAGDTYKMTAPPTHLSTTRNLWTLFRIGLVTRDKFICPSTQDVENSELNARAYWDFGIGDIDGPATPAQSRLGYTQISYGYQMPYGKDFRPRTDNDRCYPVGDKGPFGASLEAGAASPPTQFPVEDDPKLWRPWNSPNHHREGQNIVSGMSGIEFCVKPEAWGRDVIYTQSPPGIPAQYPRGRVHGGAPPAVGLKLAPGPRRLDGWQDTLIYP